MTQDLFSDNYDLARTNELLNNHLIVSEADGQGKITYVNELFCSVSGYQQHELLGKNHRLLKSGLHSQAFYRDMWSVLKSGQIWTGELFNKRKNGEHYWVKATICPFVDKSGRIYKYLSYRTEITDIKQQQQMLLDLLNTMSAGVYCIDETGVCTFINNTGAKILGYAPDELINRDIHQLIHQKTMAGQQYQASDCPVHQSLHEQQARHCTDWFTSKNGITFPAELAITPRFELGRFNGLLVVFQDITHRYQTEKKRQISVERFRRSQNYANVGSWDWDIKTGELYWSERIAPLLGYQEGELETCYQNFIQAIHPADRQRLEDAVRSSIENDEPYDIEHRVVWPDGTVRWVLERGAVYRDADGKAEKMLGTVVDIHDRKLAELKLHESQHHIAVAIEGAGDGIWDWNISTDEMQFSTLYSGMLGYLPDELEPSFKGWMSTVHPDDWPGVNRLLDDYLNGKAERYEVELRQRCKNGRWKWLLSRGMVVERNTDGLPLLMTGVMTDISKRKQIEQELITAKELAERANEAKSDFLSSMSHELRTPLNSVLGFAQLLEMDDSSPLTADQRENVDHIIQSGNHLLKLIDDVLELSKIESGNIDIRLESFSSIQAINECMPMIRALAESYGVSVSLDDIHEIQLYADSAKFKQVLLNLVSNAIKYNTDGGEVTIRTLEVSEQYYRVMVTDTGMGISDAKQARLFSAFDRLGHENSAIEGSGIGLIITKRLVNAMHGRIGFHSEEGKGSTFWFDTVIRSSLSLEFDTETVIIDGYNQLPINERIDIADRPISILCVEDNSANIKLLEKFFANKKRYALSIANTAESALELLDSSQPDLILMDINLPGISGAEAAAYIKQKAKINIPIIALTSMAMKHEVAKMSQYFDAYLTKPLRFIELTEEMSRVLGHEPGWLYR